MAIHQPNYLPWLGYFHKILTCNVFVFLDHAQLPMGRSYVQRVQILHRGQPYWLTVPLQKKGKQFQTIKEAQCVSDQDWRRDHLKTIEITYQHHPFYGEILLELQDVFFNAGQHIAEMNIELITRLATKLGAACMFVRSSDLNVAAYHKSVLLAEIVKAVGGTHYLHGGGGSNYQERKEFDERGIVLMNQHVENLTYRQWGMDAFVGGLSIVDCLFNLGYDETRNLLLPHV